MSFCKRFKISPSLLLFGGGLFLSLTSGAQEPDHGEIKKVIGCLTRAKDLPEVYVLANDMLCARIDGDFKPGKALGHTVTLEGWQTPPGGGQPAFFTPKRTLAIGLECSDTCTIGPPSGRGVHKSQKGSIGMTSGALPQPHP